MKTITTGLAALAAATLLAATAAAVAPNASEAWESGLTSALNLSSTMKASAARTFRGTGNVDGEARMFPCPMNPNGGMNGSRTGSGEVSGDIAVVSDDGKAHGTIHVKGAVWVDGFCSPGGGMMGRGNVSGAGTVYGADGKSLGQLKVSGNAPLSGSGGMSVNISGTVDVKGSL